MTLRGTEVEVGVDVKSMRFSGWRKMYVAFEDLLS